MENKRAPEDLPNALENIQDIFEILGKKKPSLFLDYDGTLTPIVSNPDDALLSEENKEIIIHLSQNIPVSIVSGRDRKDLKSKVMIDSVYYAGSHGFDITGPDDLEMQHESEHEVIPSLDKAEKNLKEKLRDISGAKVERKKYAIAVHYRNVDQKDIPTLKDIVFEEVEKHESLKKGLGKKIIELKPNLDWHKGRALDWLLENLDWNPKQFYPVFIGDDITDEDGFEAIQGKGLGIIVGTHDEMTTASYRLKDTQEVTGFLRKLNEHFK
ncbi:trehalose-phosphatase [Salegentibacter sp.]|uniref:trehalose-phosphatase n=1 Tax=Salegentibacter sp. TaxID=1903072 RepID=UPI003565741F